MSIKTNYGEKKEGTSRFVIVAPHAAGDDLRTKEISELVSRELNASYVINEKYIKPTNSRASSSPDKVEDFNKLSWSNANREYLWGGKNPEMKEFYSDVGELANDARQHGNGKSVVVYVHGFADNPEKIGIDIGFGARYHGNKLKGTKGDNKHPNAGMCSGVVRAKRADMEELRETLEEKLFDGLKVGIGSKYAAWSRQNGIQYHAGTGNDSFQLEISRLLRKPENIEYTANLIANALKKVYS